MNTMSGANTTAPNDDWSCRRITPTILRGALVDQPEVEVGLGWKWCGLGQVEDLQEVAGDEARPEQVLDMVVIHVALALGRRVVRRVGGQVSDVIGRALQALPVADIDAVHRVGLEQVLASHHHGIVLQAEPALVDHGEEEVRRVGRNGALAEVEGEFLKGCP